MSPHDKLLRDTTKALALLAHAMGAVVGAKPLLMSLDANWQAQSNMKKEATDFDHLATGMLLALSSLALKQAPDDPEAQALYQRYRPGPRH